MTDHRVGALRLHLRTHGAPPAELEAEARTFATLLLTAIAEKVEARAGGKHVVVRHLPVRLRARRELFVDRAEIARIAEDIAAAIPWSDGGAPWDGDVAIFDDAVAWRAAYLTEVVHGRGQAWCFEELAGDADGIAGLTSLPGPLVAAVLTRLSREKLLEPLLARLPPPAVAALAVMLGIPAAAASPPASVTPSAAAVRELAQEIVAAITDGTASPRATAVPHADAARTEPPLPERTTSEAPASFVTHRAGLAYVVRCLLELEAGEILWRACVPEQRVIAAALAALAGTAEDPAPALLGGAAATQAFDVSAAQREEIVAALCASLSSALPRRDLGSASEVVLGYAEGPHGRVLVAFLEGQPVYAAPAATVSQSTTAVTAFARAWPQGTIVAPPAIAELGSDARIRPGASEAPPVFALRADLAFDAACVICITAGCAAALYAARVGDLELAQRGRIHDDGDARIVTMPMEAIQIAVRRAGLDRDPGWVPWLQRHVRLVFEE